MSTSKIRSLEKSSRTSLQQRENTEKTIIKRLSVSPSQGVPPPFDQSSYLAEENSHGNSPSLTNIEVLSIKAATEALANELQMKILEYKENNQIHLEKKEKVIEESKTYSQEIDLMTFRKVFCERMEEILIETIKTKEEIKEMRENIDSFTENETSSIHFTEQVSDQLKDLKNAIDFMNHRLSVTEEDIKSKTIENEELKTTMNKLKECITHHKVLEKENLKSNCNACVVI